MPRWLALMRRTNPQDEVVFFKPWLPPGSAGLTELSRARKSQKWGLEMRHIHTHSCKTKCKALYKVAAGNYIEVQGSLYGSAGACSKARSLPRQSRLRGSSAAVAAL